jgi:hypothetical protein
MENIVTMTMIQLQIEVEALTGYAKILQDWPMLWRFFVLLLRPGHLVHLHLSKPVRYFE